MRAPRRRTARRCARRRSSGCHLLEPLPARGADGRAVRPAARYRDQPGGRPARTALSPGALPDVWEHLQRAWTDFGSALEGGKASAEGQRRVTEVLGMLQGRHIGSRRVVASHDDPIALALPAIVPE